MTSRAKGPDQIERADSPCAPAIRPSDARAAREQLHIEADVARRFAIHARLTAERARLAGYARTRHRP